MSDGSDPFGFGKFIPGFDFLQSLSASAAASAPLSGSAQWIAPTTSVEEVDKRLQELRAVQFWLEQNGRALTATIQALEVQKMTLAALRSMPGGLGEWPQAAPFKMPEAAAKAPPVEPSAAAADPAAAAIDPLQWWGALTQQFQQIASQALQEPAAQQAMQAGVQMAGEFARSAADLAQTVPPATGSAAAKSATKSTARPATKASAAKKPAAASAGATDKPAAKKPAAAAKTARR